MKYSFLKIFLSLLAAGLALPAIAAQSALPAANEPVAKTLVTVEAQHGNQVPVVNRDDVMVFEGKNRDKVVDWSPATGDHAGLDFFILIDDSSSFSLGSELGDLRNFINAQAPTTRVGVAYMQNGRAQIMQKLTTDHAAAAKALRLPLGTADANASPYFSLSDLVKRWPKSDDRKEALMVSDGIDFYYGGFDLLDPYLSQAIEDSQRAGVRVFAIYTPGAGHFGHDYWRTYWGQLYLAEVADETGAESYYIGFTGPPVDFTPYLDNIEQRLSHQYWLSFVPQPEKKAGLRSIRLTTEVPNADLVAPAKVMVPATE